MVCYQTKSGNANTQRAARAAHFVLLDRPEDLGAKLKDSYPDIGWAPDTDGHPTLPFSVGCKLILRAGAERDNRDTALFAEFPSAQYLNRIWDTIAVVAASLGRSCPALGHVKGPPRTLH